MNMSNPFKTGSRAARHAVAAFLASMMLSGCASTAQQNASACVGPPSFCNIYFGS